MAEKYSRRRSGSAASLVPSFGGVMLLYRVKWANGEISLVGLRPGDDLSDVLDEAGDPSAAEVTAYDGPVFLTFKGRDDVYVDASDHGEEMLDDLGVLEGD
jgi:hypothetical protein